MSSSSPSTPPSNPDSSKGDTSNSSPTFTDALRTISPLEDLQKLPSIPCARFSLLFGIVAGTSIGTLRFLFANSSSWKKQVGTLAAGATGRGQDRRWSSLGSAANWAVGSWGVASLGAWETCRRRQTAEAARMQALVSEVKARRAAKSSSPLSNQNLVGSAQDNNRGSNHQDRGIGGVLIGEHGKEVLQQQQQQREGGTAGRRIGGEGQEESGEKGTATSDGSKSKWNW